MRTSRLHGRLVVIAVLALIALQPLAATPSSADLAGRLYMLLQRYASTTALLSFEDVASVYSEISACAGSNLSTTATVISTRLTELSNGIDIDIVSLNNELRIFLIQAARHPQILSQCDPETVHTALILSAYGRVIPEGVALALQPNWSEGAVFSAYARGLYEYLHYGHGLTLPTGFNTIIMNYSAQLASISPNAFLALIILTGNPSALEGLNLTTQDLLPSLSYLARDQFYTALNLSGLTRELFSPANITALMIGGHTILDRAVGFNAFRNLYPERYILWETLYKSRHQTSGNCDIEVGGVDLSPPLREGQINYLHPDCPVPGVRDELKEIPALVVEIEQSVYIDYRLKNALDYYLGLLIRVPGDYAAWRIVAGLSQALAWEVVNNQSAPPEVKGSAIDLLYTIMEVNPLAPINPQLLLQSMEAVNVSLPPDLQALIEEGNYSAALNEALTEAVGGGAGALQAAALALSIFNSRDSLLPQEGATLPPGQVDFTEALANATSLLPQNATAAAQILRGASLTVGEGGIPAVDTNMLEALSAAAAYNAVYSGQATSSQVSELYQNLPELAQRSAPSGVMPSPVVLQNLINNITSNSGWTTDTPAARIMQAYIDSGGNNPALGDLARLMLESYTTGPEGQPSFIGGEISKSVTPTTLEGFINRITGPQTLPGAPSASPSSPPVSINVSGGVEDLAKLIEDLASQNESGALKAAEILKNMDEDTREKILETISKDDPELANSLENTLKEITGKTGANPPKIASPSIHLGSPKLSAPELGGTTINSGSVLPLAALLGLVAVAAFLMLGGGGVNRVKLSSRRRKLEAQLQALKGRGLDLEASDVVALYERMLALLAVLRRPKMPSETHREYQRALEGVEAEIHGRAMIIYEKAKFSRIKPTREEAELMLNLAKRLLELSRRGA
ncbi:MAG: DUF4129 domain-containing protein [Desulfurococcales archaeon]|nr:DUF4129 domain-containing protein [Desulfurococcales archaeon]